MTGRSPHRRRRSKQLTSVNTEGVSDLHENRGAGIRFSGFERLHVARFDFRGLGKLGLRETPPKTQTSDIGGDRLEDGLDLRLAHPGRKRPRNVLSTTRSVVRVTMFPSWVRSEIERVLPNHRDHLRFGWSRSRRTSFQKSVRTAFAILASVRS